MASIPAQPLELGAAAKAEDLGAVADLRHIVGCRRTVFLERVRKIETQRSERRVPQEANADRSADHRCTVKTDRHGLRESRLRVRQAVRRGCYPLIIPDPSRVREGGHFDADLLREE